LPTAVCLCLCLALLGCGGDDRAGDDPDDCDAAPSIRTGSCEVQLVFIDEVPGAAGQPRDRLPEASHFLQDDQGPEIARRLATYFRTRTAP